MPAATVPDGVGKTATKTKLVKAKKKCCKSGPRCKRCPVVCKRLEKQGMAVREGKRTWTLVDVTKPALKAARTR